MAHTPQPCQRAFMLLKSSSITSGPGVTVAGGAGGLVGVIVALAVGTASAVCVPDWAITVPTMATDSVPTRCCCASAVPAAPAPGPAAEAPTGKPSRVQANME